MADLKILSSHPVQYHVPFYRALVMENVDIVVGFYHQGTAGRLSYDAGFGMEIAWDIDLLSEYSHKIFKQGEPSYQLFEQIKVAARMLPWALKDRKTPLLLMGWSNELFWLIWLLRTLLRTPTLTMSETTPLSFASIPKPAWRISLLRWLLQHTSAALYIGKRNRDFLREMGVNEERMFHVPYSIDNDRFATKASHLSAKRRELCQQYGLDPDKPVILFCGKFISIKHPLQILEAYVSADLAGRAQLLYVGEGVIRPELEQRIQELDLKNVHILGFLNQTQMPLAYVLGELLCLISEETWGLVVNEALACGRPVIVSDTVGCVPDLVDEDTGWVILLNDQDLLAQTLLYAFNHYSDWLKMGENGRKNVADNTFSAMAKGTASALQFIQISKS